MSVHMMAPKGHIMFSQGQKPRGVSIVCVGEVKLTRSSSNGKTLLVRIAKPGDVLGLSAALAKTVYEVTAETLEYTQVKTFRREDFLLFLKHHVDGALNAADSLNTEYRAALADACRLALSDSISSRMAHLLLELAMEGDPVHEAHPVVVMSLTHEEIAAMLGSSRESVTRVLNEFKRKHIISVEGHRIRILRKYALEALT